MVVADEQVARNIGMVPGLAHSLVGLQLLPARFLRIPKADRDPIAGTLLSKNRFAAKLFHLQLVRQEVLLAVRKRICLAVIVEDVPRTL